MNCNRAGEWANDEVSVICETLLLQLAIQDLGGAILLLLLLL